MFLWSYHRKKTLWKKWNRSWAPAGNRVHPSEFVFLRNHSLSLVISGIQTHSGELHSARVPMMDSLYVIQMVKSHFTWYAYCICFSLNLTCMFSSFNIFGPDTSRDIGFWTFLWSLPCSTHFYWQSALPFLFPRPPRMLLMPWYPHLGLVFPGMTSCMLH